MSKSLFKLAKTPLGDLIIGISFSKFSKLLPVKKLRETNKILAFWHPKPLWEYHILIVPKKPIKSLNKLKKEDLSYISECFLVAKEIINELGWKEEGHAITANGGKWQEVNQLHFHLHSGNKL